MANRPTALTECPKSPDGLTFATSWYQFSDVPNFLICTKCYEDRVGTSRFAGQFQSVYFTPTAASKAYCNLNCTRGEQLFNHSQQIGHLQPLHDWALRRKMIQNCPGQEGCNGRQGVRWFGIREIPDFMACEACFEDFCTNISFSTYFTPYQRQQGPDETWLCDIATPFIKRCLKQYSTTADWTSFVNAIRHRMNMVPCMPHEVHTSSRKWYHSIALPNVRICEKCFLDEVSLLPIAQQFIEWRPDWNGRLSTDGFTQCALSKLSIQILSNQLLEKDFNRWQYLLGRIASTPPCGAEVANGEWNVLVNPWTHQATSVAFCDACHIGCVESSNHTHLFRRERIPGPKTCEFKAGHSRFASSVSAFTQMLLTRDTSIFTDYCSNAAASTPVQPNQYSGAPTAQGGTMSHAEAMALSQKLAQQHNMRMGFMNMSFASNSMHNAAMSGISNYGSAYDKYHDPAYTNAQWNYQQAQSNMFANMAQGRR